MIKRSMKKRIVHAIPLAALSLGALGLSGCTREFFRQWANQDTTEAVFEKSRDPRYRLDMFSIEPPAMSRFADPFDPDHPPAPPDDIAAEALSPVPQTPRTRLISPIEGTGYLAMLDNWARDKASPDAPDSGESIMQEPRVPDLRPVPRVPNDPETPDQTREENRAYRGDNSPYAKPSFTPPNEIGPNPSVPATPRPATPPVPGSPMSGRIGTSTNDLTSLKKLGTTDAGISPKQVDLHPGHSPAQVAQSGQRVPQAASSGDGLSQNSASVKQSDASNSSTSAFMKPGGEPVVLDTVSPERRLMVSQFTASEKTGIPLPGFNPVAKPLTDTGVVRTQATSGKPVSAETSASEAIQPGIPEPLDIQAPTMIPSSADVTDSTTKLLELLNPKINDLDLQLAAGLPRNSNIYVVTPEQSMTLALVNSRDYQTRIESIYETALPVTLQRFNMEPQVFAGLSPTTATAAGGSPTNFANSFLYRTLEAPGGQSSVLNQGQVAGVGKVFMSGARVVAAFASQTVLNLTGSTPLQPNVQSVIPITIVQPFLRGGGRAVTLEGLTQAERNLLYEVRAFARYRQDFVVKMMLGSQAGGSAANLGFSAGSTTAGGGDPTIGYMPLLQSLMQIENNRNQVTNFETVLALQEEQVGGEGSGLTQLQVDQTNSSLQDARITLLNSQVFFRNQLDQFKQQMGLPPDTPLMPDLVLISPYRKFLRELREWSVRRDRELVELDIIAGRLPDLDDLDLKIDDRSVLDVIIEEKFDEEEALLEAAVRVGLENRLDLMNARAQLYDAWRQIRVRANALKGVFNVSVTNQVFTSPLDSNPFGFLSDAKQFNLVLNAELPLVRLSERNQFRTALIDYQQQRRSLMRSEDELKRSIRQEIRQLQLTYQQYEIGKRQLILNFRQRDQSQEQLFAPGGSQDTAVTVNNLNNATGNLNRAANSLVSTYVTFLGQRLQLFRDLGIMPYDEWEAFYELFAPKSIYTVRWDGPSDATNESPAVGEPVQ